MPEKDYYIMKFKQILPHIYHIHMELCYDLAMHFWRYQEYYESPTFKGRIIPLIDYMESYAKSEGEGVFSYPDDWSGFNVPSDILIELSEAELPDLNKYDIRMRALIDAIRKKEKGHKFYFIGTCGDDEYLDSTLDHEIGHGLYHIDDEYREVMDSLIDAMPRKKFEAVWEGLMEMGYHAAVVQDEIHAYASTGPDDEIKKHLPPSVCKPFIKAYRAERKRISKKK